MNRVARVATGVVLVGTLVLAACSAEPTGPSAPEATGGATPSATAGPGDADDDAGEDGAPRAPRALGDGTGDGAVDGTVDGGAAPDPGADDVRPTAPPVELDEEASFGTGMTASIVRVDEVEAEAQGPGEVAGPALAFEVAVTNGADTPVSLDAVTVNLTDADGDPGLPMTASPADPFGGTLAPGDSATGVYVFTVDPGARDAIVLEVAYTTEAHVVLFRGDPASA